MVEAQESVADGSSEASAWNIANVVTMFRILLVPVFAVALLHDDGQDTAWRLGAFAIFLFAALTDRVDGELARRNNLVTNFGKIADPIADKALTGMALVGLSYLGLLPWWVTIVIAFREILVTVLRMIVLRYAVIAASFGGKIKTVLQITAICFFIIPWAQLSWFAPISDAIVVIGWVVMVAAVAITVWTGADYCIRVGHLLAARKRVSESDAR